MRSPKQFHQLPPEEQQHLADNYVRNMRIIREENFGHKDEGMKIIVTRRYCRGVYWPHTDKWQLQIHKKGIKRGSGVRNLISDVNRYGG